MTEEILQNRNQEEWRPSRSPWFLVIPTILAAFMFVLDETIANVALSHMAGTFSVSRDESTWILTSYLVASGIMIPAVDWFSKFLGRKNYFMMSVALFTIASFACGFANSMGMMLIARIVQGFGGGGLLPIAQAISLESFPPEKRPQSMAVFGAVVVIAPIIGPVLGGWITDNWNWPWIFFINVPLGIITLFLAQQLLEDPPYARKRKNVHLDGLGFFSLTLWIITLQVVLDKGNNQDWFNSVFIIRLSIISLIAMIVFFISQIKGKEPLVDLSVFKDRNYSIGTIVQVISQGVMLASMAILPMFLQSMLGYTSFLSGLTLGPRGCGALVGLLLSGTLSSKIDNRLLTVVGLIFMGISGIMLGNLNLEIASVNIMIPNFIFGFGMSLAMIPIVSLSVITLKNSQMTNASGLQNLLKIIGGAIGTSVVSTLISRYSQIHQGYMVGNLTPLNPVFNAKLSAMKGAFMQMTSSNVAEHMAKYSIYGEMLQQSSLWAFMEAFRIFGLACIVIIPLMFLIKESGLKKSK